MKNSKKTNYVGMGMRDACRDNNHNNMLKKILMLETAKDNQADHVDPEIIQMRLKWRTRTRRVDPKRNGT